MGTYGYKDWIADGWTKSGNLYYRSFETVEEAKVFMETQRRSPEIQAKMDAYKAKFAHAKVSKIATWRPDITYEQVTKEFGWVDEKAPTKR